MACQWGFSGQDFSRFKMISIIGSTEAVRRSQLDKLEFKCGTLGASDVRGTVEGPNYQLAKSFGEARMLAAAKMLICPDVNYKVMLFDDFPTDFVQLSMLMSGIGSIPQVIVALDRSAQSVIDKFTSAAEVRATAQLYSFDCTQIPFASPLAVEKVVKEVNTTDLTEDQIFERIVECCADVLNSLNNN